VARDPLARLVPPFPTKGTRNASGTPTTAATTMDPPRRCRRNRRSGPPGLAWSRPGRCRSAASMDPARRLCPRPTPPSPLLSSEACPTTTRGPPSPMPLDTGSLRRRLPRTCCAPTSAPLQLQLCLLRPTRPFSSRP
jgi:hypothetical protein